MSGPFVVMAGLAATMAVAACQEPDETIEPEELAELAEESPPDDAVLAGSGHYEFTGTPLAEERPVPVWYHLPEALSGEAPVALVLHGAGRDGRRYRDAWIPVAEERGFAVAVPEFRNEAGLYPGTEAYNLGRVTDSDGALRPREEWSYSVLEPLFEDFLVRSGLEADGYGLYGHSAGSQVAHRFLTLFPDARAEPVVLANAGWYTLPADDEEWPYGLAHPGAAESHGMLTTPDELRSLFERDVTILLGEEDMDPDALALRQTEGADSQGSHRVERGTTYFQIATEMAESLDVRLEWKVDTVSGVGHSNSEMAPAAAEILGGS